MHVEVTTRGAVDEATKRRAAAEIERLEHYLKGPVLKARVVLKQEQNPRIPFPARAEGSVVLAGRRVGARAAAASMNAAVDELGERLRWQARQHIDRQVTRQREPAVSPQSEWRHASLPTPRPERPFRPPQERRLERRKEFRLEPIDVAEAALQMQALDHQFFLYRDARTGTDALLYRRDDGQLAVIDPPGVTASQAGGPAREASRISRPISLDTAVREMDELGHRFLFFLNEESHRGNVIYLRFDGHYGLIEPHA
jgi:ribosome-associated translation inhibitor RaiA